MEVSNIWVKHIYGRHFITAKEINAQPVVCLYIFIIKFPYNLYYTIYVHIRYMCMFDFKSKYYCQNVFYVR